ncbi:MAG TPA: Bax inhibitor-1 family protein [Pirellulaceae bacterium]|nr:US12 family protein [Planctomycetales bacterium]MCB9938276.1 US12 family protein [Planctomycetaceae bacterium]HRX82283.1 Bax inhibitor-1 family protein [Pirellulaceae bacterium]
MNYTQDQNPYQTNFAPDVQTAALADEWERTTFIRRTYSHLLGGIGFFVLLETLIFTMVSEAALDNLMRTMMGGRWNWLLVLGAFMVVSWIARSWAESTASQSLQYLGLGAYVLAEAVIFVPLLYIAQKVAPGAIPAAGIMTAVVFTGLTAIVFTTRADFSWMGKYLALAGIAAMGLIVCGVFFQGLPLGMWFSGAMVVLAAGYILYDTSNILHRYRTDQYVAASLALFASVAILFWYVLRIMISLSSRD